jgi:excisionase family DNA binding protein
MGIEDVVRQIIREEVQRAVRDVMVPAGPPSSSDDELMSITQAAALVSTSPNTIRRWLNAGRLHRLGGGRSPRVSKAELLRLQHQSVAPRTGAITEADAEDKALTLLKERR